MNLPGFLDLPARTTKPRSAGLTHVLDKGTVLAHLEVLLGDVAPIVDIWKFGWGTAYIDPQFEAKVALLSRHDVKACTGGTLAEIAWSQGRTAQFFDWAQSMGVPCIEISNGSIQMPTAAKRQLISQARDRGFNVLSEVGSKDPEAPASSSQWVDEILGDVLAGAGWIVAEGRESGTVGLYAGDGSVKEDFVRAIEESTESGTVIYEAPQREQHAWLLRALGPDVNLGNIAINEIVSVESMRLGLRADTLGKMGVPALGAGKKA